VGKPFQPLVRAFSGIDSAPCCRTRVLADVAQHSLQEVSVSHSRSFENAIRRLRQHNSSIFADAPKLVLYPAGLELLLKHFQCSG
jgi:hypothetical protein